VVAAGNRPLTRLVATAHLVSAAGTNARSSGHSEVEMLLRSAAMDRFGIHTTLDDPQSADLILFANGYEAGFYFERVRSHVLLRSFREKSYLFSSVDRVIPFIPGVYASIERSWYWPAWARSGHYLGIQETEELRFEAERSAPKYLFSFLGSRATHAVRERVLRLRHPDALLVDTSGHRADLPLELRARYAEAIHDSQFVLCPRGGGAATFRLFESMMLGRVPVVISDEWVPPSGPDWDRCSLRVRERDIDLIPTMLEQRVDDAAVMGENARTTWLDWFSDSASFHRIIDWCLDLHRLRSRRAGWRAAAPYVQLLRPYHSARWVAKKLGHDQTAQA
jgi:hypothetical protein